MLETLKLRLADLLLPDRRPRSELDRSLAAAGNAHHAARRALAIAVAEEEREFARQTALAAKADDLQMRAIAALRGGRDDLAERAAETIAAIETDVAASKSASDRFSSKAALARRNVDAQHRRLAALHRGRRLADVDLSSSGSIQALDGSDPLTLAEAALARIEADSANREAVRLAFVPAAARVAEDLAEAGFGPSDHVLASDVMTRLRSLAAPAAFFPKV